MVDVGGGKDWMLVLFGDTGATVAVANGLTSGSTCTVFCGRGNSGFISEDRCSSACGGC